MARKEFQKIEDLFSDIAAKKARASLARFAGRDTGVERSRDVYTGSCERIASELIPDGFKFAKSGPHLSRRSRGFTYTVSFHTSSTNISGRSVSLSMAANVGSSQLKSWRSAQPHPSRADDWVCGGLAHRLGTGLTFVEWDLADPLARPAVIADVVAFIRAVILPYFRRFDSPEHIIDLLAVAPIPTFEIASSVEFALCFGDPEACSAGLGRFPFCSTRSAAGRCRSVSAIHRLRPASAPRQRIR